MKNIPDYINEICPSCNPRSYEKSLAMYTGEKENLGNGHYEYLYECVNCDARLWVDEQWIKKNEVREGK